MKPAQKISRNKSHQVAKNLASNSWLVCIRDLTFKKLFLMQENFHMSQQLFPKTTRISKTGNFLWSKVLSKLFFQSCPVSIILVYNI